MSRGADPAWRLDERDGVTVVRCAPLERLPGVRHAFSTRAGAGGEELDLGAHDDRSEKVERNRRRFLAAAGFEARRPTLLHQVHGAEVVDAATVHDGREADAVALFDRPADRVPSVRWADCVPLLLASDDGSALAAVHAGWRGTAAGIATAAVERLRGGGCPPRRLVAALGPAIGVCCYAVGEEVPPPVARAAGVGVDDVCRYHGGRTRLDLRLAVRLQLERAGVAPEAIHTAPWCTSCAHELFFSFRREGARAGRQMASIGRAAPGLP